MYLNFNWHYYSQIGALKILKDISSNTQIRRAIADLGGLQTMVKILHDPNNEAGNKAMNTTVNMANQPKKVRLCARFVVLALSWLGISRIS